MRYFTHSCFFFKSTQSQISIYFRLRASSPFGLGILQPSNKSPVTQSYCGGWTDLDNRQVLLVLEQSPLFNGICIGTHLEVVTYCS